jgi:hypothetical protein
MVNKYIFIIILLFCLILPAAAIPTTNAATLVGSNNATLNSAGGVPPVWFEWGQNTGYSWMTENSTNSSIEIYGSPLLGATQFHFRACDSTGCGGDRTFTTLSITPGPQSHFGASIDNITRYNFDIEVLARESISAYGWAGGVTQVVMWGLLFFAIYLGLFLRGKDVTIPVIVGLITGPFIMFDTVGLNLGIPPEFKMMAQGITYAALAGIVFMWIKR